jgi:hypothetical protein
MNDLIDKKKKDLTATEAVNYFEDLINLSLQRGLLPSIQAVKVATDALNVLKEKVKEEKK